MYQTTSPKREGPKAKCFFDEALTIFKLSMVYLSDTSYVPVGQLLVNSFEALFIQEELVKHT